MMKLKHLFNNEDLAEMILKNWQHDDDYRETFNYFRISANAIYPFKVNGNVQYLRFAPISEKRRCDILAEMEFIHYLKSNNYNVLEPVETKGGKEVIEVKTPWGVYLASSFKCVKGVQIDNTDFNDDIIFSYGKALGKLHQQSSQFSPNGYKRWSYIDVFQWISETLTGFVNEEASLHEVEILRDYFSNLPITKSNFGLVHYDFACDNVFYDEESRSCYAIDFDDLMYHWYVMDIGQALDSLKNNISKDKYQNIKAKFIAGYKTEYNISDNIISLMPIFRRFDNLYGYTRILRSTKERWNNEPQWMERIRNHLSRLSDKRSSFFGKEIRLRDSSNTDT